MEFYFTGSVDANTDGKITVSDKEGTILTRTFDDEMIAKDEMCIRDRYLSRITRWERNMSMQSLCQTGVQYQRR